MNKCRRGFAQAFYWTSSAVDMILNLCSVSQWRCCLFIHFHKCVCVYVCWNGIGFLMLLHLTYIIPNPYNVFRSMENKRRYLAECSCCSVLMNVTLWSWMCGWCSKCVDCGFKNSHFGLKQCWRNSWIRFAALLFCEAEVSGQRAEVMLKTGAHMMRGDD